VPVKVLNPPASLVFLDVLFGIFKITFLYNVNLMLWSIQSLS